MQITPTPRPSRLTQLRSSFANLGNFRKSARRAADRTGQAELSLPLHSYSEEHALRDGLEAEGQKLARQDRWEELGDKIRSFDQSRSLTPGGMSRAALLARGARLDVVVPVEQALSDPGLLPHHAPKGGLDHLSLVLEDHGNDYGVALVLIEACLDIAWAWRGEDSHAATRLLRQSQFQHHMKAAAELLDRFTPFEHDSPALAAARCALLVADEAPKQRFCDDYQDLIELDPGNPGPMRAFGNHLLPRWFGDYQMLEVEARKIAVLTEDIWGNGGYVWVYLDALMLDTGAATLLDPDFFLDGLNDILKRDPDQHIINSLAAFCALGLVDEGFRAATDVRLQRALLTALGRIRRHHLSEVHPLIWGQTKLGSAGPVPSLPLEALAAEGEQLARAILTPQRRPNRFT